TPTRIYGVYIAGRYKNTTLHVLTRTQVQDSLNYYCDTPFSIRMIFGGSWFCYTRFDNIGTLGYNTTATNKCASLQAGSSVIKFSEKDRECGFLTENRNGYDVFLGLVLPTGATKSATAFKYHDGTLPGALPWSTGNPTTTDATKNLVVCDASQWSHVRDAKAGNFKSLFCKKPATRLATTKAPTTTPTTQGPTTTMYCSAFQKANCGFIRTARQAVGFWGNCSAIGNATLDAMYQDCLPRMCSVDAHNNTAKCVIFEEFSTACINAGAQPGDWRYTYSCPAPETTTAPAIAAQQLLHNQNPAVKSQIAEGAPVAVDGTAADDVNRDAAVGGIDAFARGDSGDGVTQIKELPTNPQ
ncbi:hypothetical protein AAVH_33011, partial [Aphelenchoides avenae]